jgi:methylaspartate mutase epsilon subunit
MNYSGHSVLLGSVGGDSHSVGLNIIRHALLGKGYDVQYLGTHNTLTDFLSFAPFCNVAMISSMDGHAWHYLRDFPVLRQRYAALGTGPLWYLGGNLAIGDSLGHESHFREMGFERVFTNFVDIRTVLELLAQDLLTVEPMNQTSDCKNLIRKHLPVSDIPTTPTPLPVRDFEAVRAAVLGQWKTGKQAANLAENAAFLSSQPSFPAIQAEVNAGKRTVLLQPRSGVASVQSQLQLFKAFSTMGAPVLSYQVDSFTRNNNYTGAQEAIRESFLSRTSLLNGFPVINHGVSDLRRIIASAKVPLQTRHSTRDPRLLAEISFAGGVTAFEGGPICYNIPYYKDYSLRESLHRWQYVDRLTGIYQQDFGILLDREFFGTLTATLIPPCLAIATGILEATLAVQEGVRCVSLGYAEQGHRIQDIAAIRTMKTLVAEFLHNLGYHNIQINTVFHQYMAAFPPLPKNAEELILNSAVTGALADATRILVKSPVEAYKIPSMTDNLEGLSLAMAGVKKAAMIRHELDEERLQQESNIIRLETTAILDSVLSCGKGSISDGIVTGFQKGYLDIPFSPSLYNIGHALTARDAEGAVRFASVGHLQFDKNLREFHRDKMSDRRHQEGLASEAQNYLLVEKDVLRVARGQYESWPLAT